MGPQRHRAVAAAVLVALVLAACSGGGDGTPEVAGSATGSEDGAGAGTGAALLGVLEPGVDVADEPPDPAAAAFRTGEDGEGLVVGDLVRTDDAGFAEVAWFDGALARVDADTLYALVELDTTPGEAVVVTDLEVGRIWNRLRAEEVETYEVRTDVGTAAVRGTAFWVQCGDGGCMFAVLEGTVEVTTSDGTVVTLEAGQQVTVGEDGVPGDAGPTDVDDAWVLRNAPLDEDAGFDALEPLDGGALAAGDTTCPWAGMPDGWVVEPDPEATGEASEFCRLVATEDASEHGIWQDLVWIGADGPDLRGEVERARAIYEESVAGTGVVADQAAVDCDGPDPGGEFVEYGQQLGSGELLGFAWRHVDDCGNPTGNALRGIVADGQIYELNLSNRAYFEKCPMPSVLEEAEVAAFADCLFDLLETYGQQYQDLAPVFLGE